MTSFEVIFIFKRVKFFLETTIKNKSIA